MKNIKLGEGNVGIDIGTSTIAICSKDDVYIDELSKNIEKTNKKVEEIDKLMENSRRINNPDNFNEDGTIKIIENKKLLAWKNTNNYKRLRRKRKYLVTKFTNKRKNLYEKQVNELISKGDKFIVEPMDYKKLQNRKNKKN